MPKIITKVGTVILSLTVFLFLVLIAGVLIQRTRRVPIQYSLTAINNMRAIGQSTIGLTINQDGQFPLNTKLSPTGIKLHGWQVLLLPRLDEAQLFKKIDLESAWNSESNAKHFKVNMEVFQSPHFIDEYKLSTNGFPLTHFSGNSRVFLSAYGPVSYDSISDWDGLTHTIMLGEVGKKFVPWGSPGNVRDPADGLESSTNTFGGPQGKNVVSFIMCDGSVRSIKKDIDPKLLKALSTPLGTKLNNETQQDHDF